MILRGGVIDLDRYIDNTCITVEGDTIVNAINLHNNMNLKFKIKEGATLRMNIFDYAIDLTTNLDIELEDDASFILNDSFIAEVKYDLTIDTKLNGNNTYSEVNIRGINEQRGNVKIILNGTVAKETHGGEINEYAKVINKSDDANVLIPNLVVNTCDVVANHGVSIANIDEKALFYLMSKGIDKHHASKILEEGFILSIMGEKNKEKIKNILVGR